ncbi:hypothetical protein D9V32_05120 [Mycetocola tolaasinivorans]|uniref:Ribosomally synthesized peptide with SipW-like signal peptide n=1 Tax=Mycetocola tolaasinivorans TaxID=76635 RepID=A0A3L7AB07_9MICO|nr:hypothetical protein [Mycetocola tolaasinivorans]RLP77008.1 hypothetical protein D9V32_05120 [Mycetocola tolaasinivorans]
MKRTLAAAVALAVGATLGTAGAATLALWSQQTSVSDSLTIGYSAFAVSNPDGQFSVKAPAPRATVSWNSHTAAEGDPIAALKTRATSTAVIRIDGTSQGNRGLSYTMRAPTLTGSDTSLLSTATVRIVASASAAGCVTALAADSGTLYSGTLSGASFVSRQLVSSAYSTAEWSAPLTEYLCLKFTRPADTESVYTNTGTATGTFVNPETGAVEPLSATSDWSAPIGFATTAYEGQFALNFTYGLFRGTFVPGS